MPLNLDPNKVHTLRIEGQPFELMLDGLEEAGGSLYILTTLATKGDAPPLKNTFAGNPNLDGQEVDKYGTVLYRLMEDKKLAVKADERFNGPGNFGIAGITVASAPGNSLTTLETLEAALEINFNVEFIESRQNLFSAKTGNSKHTFS